VDIRVTRASRVTVDTLVQGHPGTQGTLVFQVTVGTQVLLVTQVSVDLRDTVVTVAQVQVDIRVTVEFQDTRVIQALLVTVDIAE